MADVTRGAHVSWQGALSDGRGTVGVHSDAFPELPVTWSARTEGDGRANTNPEELIAAAHATCYSMSLASVLEREGHAAERLDVSVGVTLHRGDNGYEITQSAIEVEGIVPELSDDAFSELAKKAEANCPVSNLIRGGASISLRARMASSA